VQLTLRARGDPWLYAVARVLLVPLVYAYGRVCVEGAENLPESGPAIVVANHPSDVDPILLGVVASRQLHFLADVVQFRRGFVGPVIRKLGAIPVHKGAADRAALRAALDLLARGELVALFGEGDLYRRPRPVGFRPGVAFLAARSGAPVIPVAIVGADRLWRGGRLHWPQLRVVVGEPMHPDGAGRGRGAYERGAAEVREAVLRLQDEGCGPGRFRPVHRRR